MLFSETRRYDDNVTLSFVATCHAEVFLTLSARYYGAPYAMLRTAITPDEPSNDEKQKRRRESFT